MTIGPAGMIVLKPVDSQMGYIVLLLIVLIAGLLYASHEYFPAFNPAGGTSAAK